MAQKPLQHLYLALALLLTAGITASCADDLTDGSTTGTPIAFDAPRATETRAAVEGTSFPRGSSFRVWGGRADYTNGLEFDGETVTESGGAWNYSGYPRYWSEGSTYHFHALYPADVQNATYSNGTITINNFDCSATGEDAVDLMTASRTDITYPQGGEAPGPVGFVFGHLLARVKFTVKSEGDEVTITSAKVHGINYKGTCARTETGSNWSDLTNCTESNSPFQKENISLTTDALSADLFGDLLLPPHANLSTAMLSLQYQYADKTETKTANLPLGSGTVNAWTANTSYNYSVIIPKDAVDVTLKVTVNNWTPKDVTVEW